VKNVSRARLIAVGFLTLLGASESRAVDFNRFFQEEKDCSKERLLLQPKLREIARDYVQGSTQFTIFGASTVPVDAQGCRVKQGGLFGFGPSSSTNFFTFAGSWSKAYTDVTPREAACIAVAQDEFGIGGTGGFSECSRGKFIEHDNYLRNKQTGKLLRDKKDRLIPNKSDPGKNYRVCRTRDEAVAMAGVLNTLSLCLGEDPRDLFKLFSIESGFNPNAYSGTGVDGIAQMTGGARDQILEVESGVSMDASAKARAKEIHDAIYGNPKAKVPPKSSCGIVREHVPDDPKKVRSWQGCDYLDPPRGLVAAMLDGFKLRAYYRAPIAGYKTADVRKRFGADYDKLIDGVALYSYSAAGPIATWKAFEFLVDHQKSVKSADAFLKLLKNRLLVTRESVKGEIANYLDGENGIRTKYETITKKLGGGECF
jgi:hypothetical protein